MEVDLTPERLAALDEATLAHLAAAGSEVAKAELDRRGAR